VVTEIARLAASFNLESISFEELNIGADEATDSTSLTVSFGGNVAEPG
jgi:hypothetical protein